MMIHENIVECHRLLQHDGWTTNVLWAVFKRQRVQVINGGRDFFLLSFFFFAAGVLITSAYKCRRVSDEEVSKCACGKCAKNGCVHPLGTAGNNWFGE